MIKTFLDANILFSAAYIEKNNIIRLWDSKKVQLITSAYALGEAQRNLARKRPEALVRLSRAGIRQVAHVDLTQAEFAIPVARVIIPGLEGPWTPAGGEYTPGARAVAHGAGGHPH